MKNFALCILCLVALLSFASRSFAETRNEIPVKYISSCELDLNNDKKMDLALLAETTKGRELIVLMRANDGYKAFLLSKDKPDMNLSCHFGEFIKETLAGGGTGKMYQTGGTYIQLTLPESSSVVYFWNNNAFKEVWTSD
jgi:hypothetical protein